MGEGGGEGGDPQLFPSSAVWKVERNVRASSTLPTPEEKKIIRVQTSVGGSYMNVKMVETIYSAGVRLSLRQKQVINV